MAEEGGFNSGKWHFVFGGTHKGLFEPQLFIAYFEGLGSMYARFFAWEIVGGDKERFL